jgi:hypothetical protein
VSTVSPDPVTMYDYWYITIQYGSIAYKACTYSISICLSIYSLVSRLVSTSNFGIKAKMCETCFYKKSIFVIFKQK